MYSLSSCVPLKLLVNQKFYVILTRAFDLFSIHYTDDDFTDCISYERDNGCDNPCRGHTLNTCDTRDQ